MPITVKFEWKEDEEFGGYGWIPVKFPHFNASQGLGVAHDTLEHFNDGDESLAAEMRAFGAMLYIRGESGFFYKGNRYKPGPEYAMGSDIGRFMAELLWGVKELDSPPHTHKLEEYAEEILQGIIAQGRRDFFGEIKGDDSVRCSRSDIRRWESDMMGWMRIGYRKAIRRYHKASPDELGYLFERIQYDVDKKHNDADEGEILSVSVDPKSLNYSLKREYPYDPYM